MASFSDDVHVPIPIAMEVQAMSLSTSELEVIQWLQSIGFERYQQKFVDADIFSLDVVCTCDVQLSRRMTCKNSAFQSFLP